MTDKLLDMLVFIKCNSDLCEVNDQLARTLRWLTNLCGKLLLIYFS